MTDTGTQHNERMDRTYVIIETAATNARMETLKEFILLDDHQFQESCDHPFQGSC